MYDHYRAINSSSMSMQSEGETSRMEVDDDPQKLASQYKAFRQGTQSIWCRNEVGKSLMDDCEGENKKNFNLLGWWKSNTSKHSVLSQLALNVLDVSVFY